MEIWVMKLSTRSRYGLKAMLEMALRYGEGPLLVRDIARRQDISRRYLEHLIVSLQAAGLVETMRGARGGCVLARPPSQIKLGEVVQALEGSLTPVDCNGCARSETCVPHDIWARMGDAIADTLNSITLEDMVRFQDEKAKSAEAPMYYI
jgi:Rrf2 family cysteine metabolism transcriptional repressor